VLGVESAALELRKVLASVDGPRGLAASLSGEGAAAAATQRNAKQATQAMEVATALEAVAGLGASLEVRFFFFFSSLPSAEKTRLSYFHHNMFTHHTLPFKRLRAGSRARS